MLMEIRQEFQRVTSPETMAETLRSIFAMQHPFDQDKEQFFAIGLNTKHVVQYIDMISMGTLDASLVHPRECFRHAVAYGVAAIAVAHNHPSGCTDPSPEDILVTKKLIEAGTTLGIPVIDHLIFSTRNTGYLSLREDRPSLNWPP